MEHVREEILNKKLPKLTNLEQDLQRDEKILQIALDNISHRLKNLDHPMCNEHRIKSEEESKICLKITKFVDEILKDHLLLHVISMKYMLTKA